MSGFFGGGSQGSGGPPNVITTVLPAGQTNDLAVTFSLSVRNILRVTTNAAGSTLSGVVAPTIPLTLGITNVGPVGDLTLLDVAGSLAANQFNFEALGDFILPAGAGLELWYDTASSMWRVLSA